MTTEVDVLIIGGGSAGLCAGVWLARNGISYRILERRPGRMTHGQADGVQVRTVEVFESFGISEELLKEAYHALEDTFWSPAGPDSSEEAGSQQQQAIDGVTGKRGIQRTYSTPDTKAGLSHLPHVILNQARINALLTEAAGATNVEYGCHVQDIVIDKSRVGDPDAHCVTVTATKDGSVEQILYKAKYVLGSDGAHSQVRKSLGFKMVGDTSDEVWGVMDVYPKTNFPDIRKKAIVRSVSGNILIIPREGDSMVRMYINLSGGAAAARDVTVAQLHQKARQIFQPYTMEFPETAWWSAYVIGQRLADEFHAHYRVFLSGDACHTHSPKAGQGMNVSLQDGYNIGWKLAAVLRKQASPELLETYVLERQKTAADLIEFDRYWSKLFSTDKKGGGITPEVFVKAGYYTAGLATQYTDSIITATTRSQPSLATKLTVGMRFPSTLVIRVGDARQMWLTRALPADSRWHLAVFGGDIQDAGAAQRLQKVGHTIFVIVVLWAKLTHQYQLALDLEGLVRAFTPSESDIDSVFNIVLILASQRANVELETIPEIFTPVSGKWKLNIFVDDENYDKTHGHSYEAYGIAPNRGALVVIRPDQYISRIDPLDDIQDIDSFFDGFLKRLNP
ncbi:hypothetical protein GQX73_g7730 [Xylaria multiplex]|uniref:FAD-binding domain-containing protein n=1 Tax=Xylaria multiplex TaxID=323545 RepID=A0A7C8MM53_9PEZI|nr:hypothetical protein GQX73_g7730 [Xylaria multiplex]